MKNRIKISLSVLIFSLLGCSTVEMVNDSEYLSRNSYVGQIRVDSIMLRDSIFIRERSDTVFYTKFRTIYKERVRVDTVVRCDTLFRDREVVVERTHATTGLKTLFFRFLLVALCFFLLWRTGVWNLILKGVRLCIKIFRLEE